MRVWGAGGPGAAPPAGGVGAAGAAARGGAGAAGADPLALARGAPAGPSPREGPALSPEESLRFRAFWGFANWFFGDWLDQRSEGAAHLPASGAFLIASNHSSHFDCPAVFIAARSLGVDRVYAMGARDYFFTSPFRRWFATHIMSVFPISRRGVRESEVDAIRAAIASCPEGQRAAIVIFPEGTRSTSGEVRSFKAGVGLLSAKLGVPVVPAFVHGTQRSLPKRTYVPQVSRVTVRFGEPLQPPRLADAQAGSASCRPEVRAANKAALFAFRDQLRKRVMDLQREVLSGYRPLPDEPIDVLREETGAALEGLRETLASAPCTAAGVAGERARGGAGPMDAPGKRGEQREGRSFACLLFTTATVILYYVVRICRGLQDLRSFFRQPGKLFSGWGFNNIKLAYWSEP